jgi:hypothetical protein
MHTRPLHSRSLEWELNLTGVVKSDGVVYSTMNDNCIYALILTVPSREGFIIGQTQNAQLYIRIHSC